SPLRCRISCSPRPRPVKMRRTNCWYARCSRSDSSGSPRRWISSRPESTPGRGRKAEAGTRRARMNSKQGPHWAVISVAPPAAAPGQQVTQRRSGQVVGQVGDQGGACGRVVSQQVAVSHGDVRAEPAGELGGRALIDLDRLEGSAELGQGDGQRSVSWAPFDDRAVAAGGEFHDAGDGAAVAEEVLAQFMGSGMVTRHEGSWDGA